MPARILLSHVKALGFDFARGSRKAPPGSRRLGQSPGGLGSVPGAGMPLHPLVATAVTVGSV
jgi:hypothetical protein